MMLTPTHHFRDIERKPEYLQPEKCAPPPFPGPAGTMWFIRDGCGIACAIVTWFLVLYAEFVVLFVMLIPSRDYAYSIINGIVFNLLAFLALASHCRAMLTDPVSMSGLLFTSLHSLLRPWHGHSLHAHHGSWECEKKMARAGWKSLLLLIGASGRKGQYLHQSSWGQVEWCCLHTAVCV